MDCIRQYINYLSSEKHYSPHTIIAYEQDIKEFCDFVSVDTKQFDPHQYDEDDIKTWIIDMMEEKKFTSRSVRRKISSLRGLYKYLVRTGVVNKNITKKILLPKMSRPLPNYFREEEMRAVISEEPLATHYNDFVKCLIIEMFYQTGMRQAELLNLKDSDVDINDRSIKVFGKRRKERIIPFGDRLTHMIKEYLIQRNQLLQEAHISLWNSFWMRTDKKDRPVALTRFVLYKYVCDKMGKVSTLKKHSPHVLRHTCATAMLDGGADIRTIQKLLGHAGLTSTQIYTHVSFDKIKTVYKNAHPRAKNE